MPLESEGLFFLIILVVPWWMGSNPTFKMKDSRVGLVKKLQSFEWPGIHPDLGIHRWPLERGPSRLVWGVDMDGT